LVLIKNQVSRCHPERLIALRIKLYTRRINFSFNEIFLGKRNGKKLFEERRNCKNKVFLEKIVLFSMRGS